MKIARSNVLKFADTVREKNADILKEDYAQRFDADFVLMTGILSKLTGKLYSMNLVVRKSD